MEKGSSKECQSEADVYAHSKRLLVLGDHLLCFQIPVVTNVFAVCRYPSYQNSDTRELRIHTAGGKPCG